MYVWHSYGSEVGFCPVYRVGDSGTWKVKYMSWYMHCLSGKRQTAAGLISSLTMLHWPWNPWLSISCPAGGRGVGGPAVTPPLSAHTQRQSIGTGMKNVSCENPYTLGSLWSVGQFQYIMGICFLFFHVKGESRVATHRFNLTSIRSSGRGN